MDTRTLANSRYIALIRRRHGLIARLSCWWEDRHAGDSPVGNHVGIAVRVGRTDAGDAGEPESRP